MNVLPNIIQTIKIARKEMPFMQYLAILKVRPDTPKEKLGLLLKP